MLTLLSVRQGTIDFSLDRINLNGILSQDNVVWFSTEILTEIMPQYFVLFSILDESLAPASKASLESFTHNVMYRFFASVHAAHLPALFALQTDPQNSEHSLKGFLYSWYCAALERTEFSCSSSVYCPAKMMETYLTTLAHCRRSIPLTYVKQRKRVLPSALDMFCPLTIGHNSTCTPEEIDLVTSFITEGTNRTAAANTLRVLGDAFLLADYKKVAPST